MMRQQQQEQRDGNVVAVSGDTANDDISPGRAETNVVDVTAKNTNEMTTTIGMAGSSDDRKSIKSTNAKNNKRKRLQEKQSLPGDEPEKRQQLAYQLLDDYYQRLVYQCHKDLNKHIKRTKNFLLQKQIRIIKEMTAATAKKEEGKEEATKNVPKQQGKLQQMKDCFNLPNNKTVMNEMILQECDRRLGILQLDPKLLLLQQQQPDTTASTNTQLDMDDTNNDDGDDSESDDDENTDIGDNPKEAATTGAVPTPPKSSVTITSTETITAMTQRILQHKSIMTALERWHQEVTQYRIWSMQQQERLLYQSSDDHHKFTTSASTFTTKKKKKGTNVREAVSPAHHSTGSMFVSLGHDDNDDDDDGGNQDWDPDDPYSYYGPAGTGPGSGTTKKNRQGQRGRRAKMAALAAKKLGRSIPKEESINWRRGGSSSSSSNNNSHTKSNHHDHHRNPSSNDSHGTTSRDEAPTQHKTTDNCTADTLLHPSWQAKKESKASIVAFQGTKITFG